MRTESIYKGATRPAMKFGIPLVPLVAVFALGMLVTMWGGTLFSWWIGVAVAMAAIPTLIWMRFTTSKDDQRFRQIVIDTRLRLQDRNRGFWRTRSYAPYSYRGTSDAWHA